MLSHSVYSPLFVIVEYLSIKAAEH